MITEAHEAGAMRWRALVSPDGSTSIAISNEGRPMYGDPSSTQVTADMGPRELLHLADFFLRAVSASNANANAYALAEAAAALTDAE